MDKIHSIIKSFLSLLKLLNCLLSKHWLCITVNKEEEILKTKFRRDPDCSLAALIWNSRNEAVLKYNTYCSIIDSQICIKQLRILFSEFLDCLLVIYACELDSYPFSKGHMNMSIIQTHVLTHLKAHFESGFTLRLTSFCAVLGAVSIIVQVDIFQYRRLNHCCLLLVASHFSDRAKPLGNYLMQGFLSMKSLVVRCWFVTHSQSWSHMKICRNSKERVGLLGYCRVVPSDLPGHSLGWWEGAWAKPTSGTTLMVKEHGWSLNTGPAQASVDFFEYICNS